MLKINPPMLLVFAHGQSPKATTILVLQLIPKVLQILWQISIKLDPAGRIHFRSMPSVP